MNKIKHEVIVSVKINRFLVLITLVLFLISLLIGLGIKLGVNKTFHSLSMSNAIVYLIFGFIMVAILGLYQLIVTQLSALDWKSFMGKSSKILKIYNRILLFYIFSFIVGILSSGYLRSLFDYSLYSVIREVFNQCFIIYIPLVLAIIFTVYIETLKKEI